MAAASRFNLWLLCAALLSVACGAHRPTLRETPGEAADHVGELLGALASRFGPLEREAAFDRARPLLARGALVPSRVFDAPAVWTSRADGERAIELLGVRTPTRYRMAARASPAAPLRAAEYRGRIGLRAAGGPDYEWKTRDELAVGHLSAAAVADGIAAVLEAAAMARPDARPDLLRALPRTSAALGRLWSLERLAVTPVGDGSARVELTAREDFASLEPHFPRYASFLRRYVTPLRVAFDLGDAAGARFLEVRFAESRLSLKLRTARGALVPLAGGRAALVSAEGDPSLRSGGLPERLRARAEFSTRSGVFRLGFRNLESEVTVIREPHRQGLLTRFRREPDWELPFLVESLFRAPLRQPFAGEGAAFSVVAQGDGAAPTLLVSESRLAVRESRIVRWLSGFAGMAVDDFRAGAEEESDRFAYEALLALRADLIPLLGRARP